MKKLLCALLILSLILCGCANTKRPDSTVSPVADEPDLTGFDECNSVTFPDGTECRQYIQKLSGLEILNGGIRAVTDPNGETKYYGRVYELADGDTFNAQDIDSSPAWLDDLQREVSSILIDRNSVSSALYIDENDVCVPVLRFEAEIITDGEPELYTLVASADGEILYECEPHTVSYQSNNVVCDGSRMKVVNENGKYYGFSPDYHYFIWNKQETNPEIVESDLTDNGFVPTLSDMFSTDSSDWSFSKENQYPSYVFKSMKTLNQVESFFAREYGYHGVDGKKGYAKVAVLDRPVRGTAFAGGNFFLCLGTTSDRLHTVADAPEILAHEYTHCILKNYCRLKNTDESGALHEAIADVFGVVFANREDWHLASAFSEYGSDKDIASKAPVMKDFQYEEEAYFFQKIKCLRIFQFSTTFAHQNAYILSHALYNISMNVFQNNLPAFGKIVFHSLRYLGPNSVFSDYRAAFEASVEELYDAATAEKCGVWFDKAGIKKGNIDLKKVTIGIQTVGEKTSDLVTTTEQPTENAVPAEAYLSYFDNEVFPLLKDAYANILPEGDGIAVALPLSATGKDAINAYAVLNWYELLLDSKYDRYYDAEYMRSKFAEGSGSFITDAPFLTENDIQQVIETEQILLDEGKAVTIWCYLKPDELQYELDKLLGRDRVDVRQVIENDERGFVSENDYLMYLAVDGIGGDLNESRLLYRVEDCKIEPTYAVLTINIFSVLLPIVTETDFTLCQRQRFETEGQTPPDVLMYMDQKPDWPFYADRIIGQGEYTPSIEEYVLNGDGNGFLDSIAVDESLFRPIEVTLYNTRDGIRLWDIDGSRPE